jgi:ribosomal protein L11 methylase PrmA
MDIFNAFGEIFLFSLVLVASIFFLIMIIISAIGVPFLPSSKRKVDLMISLANLNKDSIVYDLGSGDGRLVIEAAKKGVSHAVGFEINPILNLFARIRAYFLKLKNLTFFTKSMWKADLSKPDIIFLYLLPSVMLKLEEKLINEGKENMIIISNTFKFKKIPLIKEFEKEKIYVYKLKSNTDDNLMK